MYFCGTILNNFQFAIVISYIGMFYACAVQTRKYFTGDFAKFAFS